MEGLFWKAAVGQADAGHHHLDSIGAIVFDVLNDLVAQDQVKRTVWVG